MSLLKGLQPKNTTFPPLRNNEESTAQSLAKLESWLAPLLFTITSFALRMYRISLNNGVCLGRSPFWKVWFLLLETWVLPWRAPTFGENDGWLVWLVSRDTTAPGTSHPVKSTQIILTTLRWDFPGYIRLVNCSIGLLHLQRNWLLHSCNVVVHHNGYIWVVTTLLWASSSCLTLLFCFSLRLPCLPSLASATLNNKSKNSRANGGSGFCFTGISIGCTCSTKMVGLFSLPPLVGIYTVVDLWNKFGDKVYFVEEIRAVHWATRIFALIIVPFLVFLLSFKIHFDLLYKSEQVMPTCLLCSKPTCLILMWGWSKRCYNWSLFVTLKNQGLTGGLLHSHVQTFPEGSKQQRVTTYSPRDSNNNWIFKDLALNLSMTQRQTQKLSMFLDSMTVRLIHPQTGRNLHTHDISAPVQKSEYRSRLLWKHDCWRLEG